MNFNSFNNNILSKIEILNNNIKVIKYSPFYYKEWNDFVADSKNATFLFQRDFMEYHKDKFEDFSLMIFYKDCLEAVLPANRSGKNVFSHKWLSYGGLVLSKKIKLKKVLEICKELLKYLKDNNIETLCLNQIPSIYNEVFSQETEYLMFILKADLYRRDTLSVLSINNKIKISKDRIKGYKRGVKHNLEVREESNFELFWNEILIKNLNKRYGVNPVHTLDEIVKLKCLFNKEIRLFNVYKDGKIVAGTVIFESEKVAHSQYISANEDRSLYGCLDFLYYHLVNEVFNEKDYFDFGNSNIDEGKGINEGLLYWKEGFGARTVIQNYYRIKTNNYSLLENVFL